MVELNIFLNPASIKSVEKKHVSLFKWVVDVVIVKTNDFCVSTVVLASGDDFPSQTVP